MGRGKRTGILDLIFGTSGGRKTISGTSRKNGGKHIGVRKGGATLAGALAPATRSAGASTIAHHARSSGTSEGTWLQHFWSQVNLI